MTDGQSILKTSLLDLLYELRDQQGPLILGGGYGLYLKQVRLQETLSSPTLISGELWPVPRATEDLDILLKTEVVVDTDRMRPIRAALDKLGYAVIETAKYTQFVKPLGLGMDVKVDFLTGPLGAFAGDPRVKVDARRVRPRKSVHLHAARTDEAVGFQEDTLAIPVNGTLSNGQDYEAVVHVPQAFTLLLMKLYAFRDRCMDAAKDMARHHALDLYRIVAIMTDDEFQRTGRQVEQHNGDPVVVEARRIVGEHFASSESLGSLRLREHRLWREGMALDEFLSTMKELFRVSV
jgi:hypothetical protein